MRKEGRKSPSSPDFERLGWPSKQEVIFVPGWTLQIIPYLDPKRGRQLFDSFKEEVWRDGNVLDVVSIRDEDWSVAGDVIFWGINEELELHDVEYPSGRKVPITIDVRFHKFPFTDRRRAVFYINYDNK